MHPELNSQLTSIQKVYAGVLTKNSMRDIIYSESEREVVQVSLESLKEKLNPRRFSGMSGRMGAILGYILGEAYTEPQIHALSITSDGFLVSGQYFLGDAKDLEDNVTCLLDCADLTAAEKKEFRTVMKQKVQDWRHY